MADFLTAVSTKKIAAKPAISKIQDLSIQDVIAIDSAHSSLQALRNQPSHGTVMSVLNFLNSSTVSLIIAEPVYASIAHELVNNTVPNYWRILKPHTKDIQKLSAVLRNPPGVGHLITRLRTLTAESRQRKVPGNAQAVSDFIEDTLDVLSQVLSGEDIFHLTWIDIQAFAKNDTQKKLLWKEFLAQVASGRVLSVTAEAEDMIKEQRSGRSPSSGAEYAEWLGCNITHMLAADKKNDAYVAGLVEFSSKVLILGYTGKGRIQRIFNCR